MNSFVSFISSIDSATASTVHVFMLSHAWAATVAFCLNYAFVIALVVLIGVHLYPRRKRLEGLLIPFAMAAAYVLSRVIGMIYFRPRPFVTLQFLPLIAQSPLSKSFPSSHVIVAFAGAYMLYKFNKKYGYWAFALAGLIALSRIAVGVHYPTDVLAGAVLGVLLSGLIYRYRKSLWVSSKS